MAILDIKVANGVISGLSLSGFAAVQSLDDLLVKPMFLFDVILNLKSSVLLLFGLLLNWLIRVNLILTCNPMTFKVGKNSEAIA